MEKKKPLVSVIIPVYNPGECIKRCINSVLNQTLKDIEIIFIDDCGTDNSIDIVRNSAKEDDRIVILVNEVNSGPGYSRNRGIDAAQGEYVAFVDPDDYIAEDFLELLYKKTEGSKPDIVKGERLHVNINGEIDKNDMGIPLNAIIRAGLLRNRHIFSLFTYNHWTAIFRHALLMESGARYGLARNAQDSVFLLRVGYFAKTIVLEDKAIYYYVSREASRMRDCSAFRLRQELISLEDILSFIQAHYDGSNEQNNYVNSIIGYNLRVQAWAAQNDKIAKDAKQYLDEIRAYTKNLPFAEKLEKGNSIIKALIKYGYNLSIEPYRIQGIQTSVYSYVETIERWADFMEKYPENTTNYSLGYHWKKLYVKALSNPLLDKNGISGQEKKQFYKEIRELTKRVKNTDMLKQSKRISLFLSTGINLFAINRALQGTAVRFIFPKKIKK